MSSLTELPPSLPSTVSVEDMSQPVTTPASSELASQLEELSGLASQILRFSNELQKITQSDFLVFSQAPVPPPSPLPFVPPPPSFTPTPIIAETHRPVSPALPSATHADVDMKQEESAVDALLALAEPRYDRWSVFIDSPPADTEPTTQGPPRLTINTTHTPAVPLEPSLPFRYTPPPTQRWPFSSIPLPPIEATPHRTPARHSVPLAELVDEEGTSPGTRGGMRPFLRPAATPWATMSQVDESYPRLSIITVDVTPPFAGRANPEASEIPEHRPLRSSPLPPRETPEFSTIPVQTLPRSSPMSPDRNDRRRAGGEGSRTPRRSKRKGAPPVDPEVPDRRVTRSRSVKGQATEYFGTRAAPYPKRSRTSSP